MTWRSLSSAHTVFSGAIPIISNQRDRSSGADVYLQWKRKSYATKLNLVIYIFEVVYTSISIYCFFKFPLRYVYFYQLVCRFR